MPDPQPVPWWTSTSIYQVYPRSFADSNGDGIGDLPGIVAHLDHLVELGVGTVWVSPFFASPQRDIGYDVSDYRAVAPEYGDLDDAQTLIDEAHARGLRVLFDLVLNHTSDEHPWFTESRSSRDNPKADWYVWSDGRPGRGGKRRPPNNWRSELQLTKAWQWGEERQQWYLATFLPFQPDLNWRHPEVRAEMFDMVRMWLGRGVDGFRLDIFGSIMQDADLRPNDPRPRMVGGIPRVQTPNHTLNTDENFALAGDLRAVCDEFTPERVLLGEVFGEAPVLRRYVRDGDRDGLHLVFLFDFLAARYGAATYRRLIERFERDFAPPLLPTYVLENHDRTRSLSRVGGDMAKARVLATLLCTLRGVPVIYQGQEIGMTNRYIPLRDANDPIPGVVARHLPEAVNRRLTERLNRDEVRTPMQWTDAPGAGFCPDDVTPWLPVNENRLTRNVEAEADDPTSLLAWYRSLLALRAERPSLHQGTLRLLPSDADSLVAYERTDGDDRLLVTANLGDAPVVAEVDAAFSRVVLASSERVELQRPRRDGEPGHVLLPAHTAAILGEPER
ncbi:MAG: alpha-amylase family glycosyl hydrolase [Acidimicrobiales bacterium]